jgi:hypothetical protein
LAPFYAPVCYGELKAKTGEIKMLKRLFMDIASNVSDSLHMKILILSYYLKKWGKIISRGVFVPPTPGSFFMNRCSHTLYLKVT